MLSFEREGVAREQLRPWLFPQKSGAGFTGRRDWASSQVVAFGISLNSLELRDL